MAATAPTVTPLTIIGPAQYTENKEPTDFCIKVEHETFEVHRKILAASSDFYRALFNSGMREVGEGVIVIKDYPVKIVRTVICYIYGKDITIAWDDIVDYLDLVECWMLTDLKERLQKYILPQIDVVNCIQWYSHADRYHLDLVSSKSRTLVKSDFVEVSENPAFLCLEIDELQGLVTHDVMSEVSSEVRHKTIMNWILADESTRGKYFNKLLEHFQFTKCSSCYLSLVLEKYSSSLSSEEVVAVSSYITIFKELAEGTIDGESEEQSKIIFLGACDGDMEDVTQGWELDLKVKSLKPVQEIPEILLSHDNVRCKTPAGIFHVGGGKRPHFSYVSDCVIDDLPGACAMFDPLSWQFTRLPDPSTNVCRAGATYVNDKVYVIGGLGTAHRVQCLDLKTLKWEHCPDLKEGVYDPIVCGVGPRVFVISQGEYCLSTSRLQYQCYDTRTKRWILANYHLHKPITILGVRAVAIGQDMYLVGGKDQLCIRCSLEEDNKMTTRGLLKLKFLSGPECQWVSNAVVIGKNKILVSGGGEVNTVEEYDIPSDTWQKTTEHMGLNTCHHFCVALRGVSPQML